MNRNKNLNLPNKEELEEAYEKYHPMLNAVLFGIEKELKGLLNLASMPTYKSRVKSFKSYYKKLLRIKPASLGNQELPTITDLVGIRVICAFLEDLAVVEQQIVEHFNIIEIERKGADRDFSEFGYESVHILVSIPDKFYLINDNGVNNLPEGLVCEIQIRTILQDAWAEVEHELVYKSEFSPFDLPLRRKLASMNASLGLADIVFQEIRDYQNKLNRELECRRNTFYDQADGLTRQKLEEGASEIDDSIEIKKPALQYVHGTIDDMILDAIHAHNTGDLEKAVLIYSKIIESKPEPNPIVLSVIYKHRGMAFFAQNKYSEALGDFQSSVKHNAQNFRSLYYIGIVYCLQNKDKEAIEYFDKSIEINEYQSHVYYRRALSEYHLGNFDIALNDLNKAQQLGLDDEDTHKLYENIKAKIELKV